ncbi:MAG: hypothetical protein ACFE8O_10420 [Candidatus Hermodarchaeota archaeon]
MAKNKTLILTGIILSAIAAIIAVFYGIMLIAGMSLMGIAYGILYLALGLLSLLFCVRLNKRYDSTYFILLLVFAIIFLIVGGIGLSLTALIGILMLIGVILIFVGRA